MARQAAASSRGSPAESLTVELGTDVLTMSRLRDAWFHFK
jgi:hypothetical protein